MLFKVLILVLLELILLLEGKEHKGLKVTGFNPCFIGTYSFTILSPSNSID